MIAVAWATLDAEDAVREVWIEKLDAERYADRNDGWHVKPLVLADLDVVDAIADQRAAAVRR